MYVTMLVLTSPKKEEKKIMIFIIKYDYQLISYKLCFKSNSNHVYFF